MNTIIGVCGHIDHGKTTLIKCLNGFEGDSLEEEKKRGITIENSFSSLKENEIILSFIDVPGHESLIKNMINASFSFNDILFVVDINEGMMPQSFEHLFVLKILNIQSIILILSKCDKLAKNPEKINSNQEKIIKQINDFGVKIKAIFKTSKENQKEFEKLKHYLLKNTQKSPNDDEIVKFYVDRSFDKKGIGKIITGTLIGGSINIGDKLFSMQNKKDFKIKSMQNHSLEQISVKSPARIAMQTNAKFDIKKNDFICKMGEFRDFDSFECELFNLQNLKHNTNYFLITNNGNLMAKILFLEKNYATIKLSQKLSTFYNQKFILLSNGRVVGGGVVLNPINEPMKKNEKIKLLNALRQQKLHDAFKIISAFHPLGFGLLSASQRFGITKEKALKIAKDINEFIVDEKNYNIYQKSSKNIIKNFIFQTLLKNKKALFSSHFLSLRLSWASNFLCDLVLKDLKNEGVLQFENGCFFDKSYQYENLQNDIKKTIFQIISNDKITPKAPYNIYDELDIDKKAGDNALKQLCATKKITRLSHNLFVNTQILNDFIKQLIDFLQNENAEIDVSFLKNRFNLSRKYAICYLDYLDKNEKIININNVRKLKKT